MRKAIKVWMAVAIAAGMILMAGAGAASAAVTSIQPRFTAQAHAAGLSAAQANQLQREVTNYIHMHGGTQAALNVVDFSGGSITFVVPGERYARDLATDPRPLAAAACGATAFCEYSGTFYGGAEVSIFDNCEYQEMLFFGEGSYINHLPNGGWSIWYDGTKTKVLYVTPEAPDANPEVNWSPVVYTIACY